MRIIDNGEYTEDRDGATSLVQRAVVAAGGPMLPPKDWYKNPGLDRPTPITVTADGRIQGHIATWASNHIGLPPGTKPPRSQSEYAFFETGVLQTDDGSDVRVGQLTLAGGHAPMSASAQQAVEHYDNTASAVADVRAGEDAHGIWITGGLRPSVTDEQVRALRASAPSGDWRPIDGALELVAVCQVNTPGFPVARAMVASGQVTALVAAGAGDMYGLQIESAIFDELARVHDRIDEQDALIASLKSKGRKGVPEDDDDDAEDEDADSVAVESEGDDEPDSDDDDESDREKLRSQFKKLR